MVIVGFIRKQKVYTSGAVEIESNVVIRVGVAGCGPEPVKGVIFERCRFEMGCIAMGSKARVVQRSVGRGFRQSARKKQGRG